MSTGTDVAGGGFSGHLAQVGDVVGRMRAALRRRRTGTVAGPAPDEASFEAHVEQALRIVRGQPALHVVRLDEPTTLTVVNLDDGTVVRSGR